MSRKLYWVVVIGLLFQVGISFGQGYKKKLELLDLKYGKSPLKAVKMLDSLVISDGYLLTDEDKMEINFKKFDYFFSTGDLSKLYGATKNLQVQYQTTTCQKCKVKMQLVYSDLFLRQNLLDSALIAIQLGMAKALELADTSLYITCSNDLANLYGSLAMYRKSNEMYDEISAFRLAEGDTIGAVEAKNNKGINYLEAGEVDTILHYSHILEQQFLPQLNPISKVVLYQNLADAYLLLENDKLAKFYLDSAFYYSSEMPYLHVTTLSLIGDYYFGKRRIESSKKIYLQAMDIADSLGLVSDKSYLYYSLSEVFGELGDAELALEALKRHSDLRFEMLEKEQKISLNEAALRWNTMEKDKAIRRLVEENDKNKQTVDQFNQLKWWLGSLFVLLITFSSILITRNRLKTAHNKKLQHQVAKRTKEIQMQYNEKSLMLRELHHRVKNNMQLIISFLRLQSHFKGEKDVDQVLAETVSRIQGISAVHEELYTSQGWTHEKSSAFFTDYIRQIFRSLHPQPEKANLEVHVENLKWSETEWVPVALILNEWLSNGVKYAYDPGEQEKFEITLMEQEGKRVIRYRDFGRGMKNSPSKGLGLTIVEGLVGQVSGTLRVVDVQQGVQLEVVLP